MSQATYGGDSLRSIKSDRQRDQREAGIDSEKSYNKHTTLQRKHRKPDDRDRTYDELPKRITREMRELERHSLSMLWEKPSYDDDYSADALDLEDVERCAAKEGTSSLERYGSAKERSQRANQQVADLHATEDGKARSSFRKRQVERWLEEEHRHKRLWRLRDG